MIDAALGNYLAGLIDGEGCFLIVRKLPRPDMGASMRIELHADDEEILRTLKTATGLGIVKPKVSPSQLSPHVVWEINSKQDCAKLVETLDMYPLRAKKRNDYLVWREFVAWWTTRKMGDSWEPALVFRGRLAATRNGAS